MHESFRVMDTRGGEQKWRADNDTLIMGGECRGVKNEMRKRCVNGSRTRSLVSNPDFLICRRILNSLSVR